MSNKNLMHQNLSLHSFPLFQHSHSRRAASGISTWTATTTAAGTLLCSLSNRALKKIAHLDKGDPDGLKLHFVYYALGKPVHIWVIVRLEPPEPLGTWFY